jgi:MFS transporter, CP family, cyanate transporter
VGSARSRRRSAVLLGLAVALAAVNLRPALASVGPVLTELRADLGLSGGAAAVLTSVPVLCLGLLAPAAPALARRWGIEPVIALVLGVLGTGLLVRVLAGTTALFVGTILASGAIAVANVLLPAQVKRDFPASTGTMMGVYTMSLSGSAAVAAGATAPLAEATGSWRGGLGAWAVPAAVALLCWLPLARHSAGARVAGARAAGAGTTGPADAGGALRRDPLAWQVTAFFGLQSLSFYAVLSWLPTIYQDAGYSAVAAGAVLSASALVQIPVALLLPRLATRARTQRAHALAATLLAAIGLTGVLVAPTAAPYLWAVVLGAGQGAAFAVALILVVLRARTPADTAGLSALAQSVGYVLAASGPLLVGAVHGWTGSWTLPILLLLLLLVPQGIAGVLAGRPLYAGTQATRVGPPGPARPAGPAGHGV